MKRLHCLLDGSVVVETVALQHVDIVELETAQGVLDRVEDVLAG
jgi:hypothetical protein